MLYEIHVQFDAVKDEKLREAGEKLYKDLQHAGLEALLDDRDERPGVKFKDADLLGFPIRVNVGGRALKEGKIEVVARRDKSVRAVAREDALDAVAELRDRLAR